MHTLKLTGAIGLLSAVLASACSSSSLPTSPSAVPAFDGAQASSLAGDSSADPGASGVSSTFGKPTANGAGNGNGGNGNGNGNGGGGNGNGNGGGNGQNPAPSAPAPNAPAPKKVELEGLISAIAGNVLTVNGQNVTVPATVVPHHGSKVVPFADLKVGDRVQV
jgi:hypothetical protein